MDQTWMWVIGTVAGIGVTISGALIGFSMGITGRVSKMEAKIEASDAAAEKAQESLSESLTRVERRLEIGFTKLESEWHSDSVHINKEIGTLREHFHDLAGTVQGIGSRTDLAVEVMKDVLKRDV